MDMLLNLRRRVSRARRAALLCTATLAAGVGLMIPATAGAHGRAGHEPAVSEEAASSTPAQSSSEASAGAPPVEASAPTQSSSEAPASTTPVEARTSKQERREQRRTRRLARRARHELSPGASCSIDLQATPSIVTAPTTLSLLGTLSCAEGASAGEQTVTLYQRLVRGSGFTMVATTSTEASGAFQFTPASPEADSAYYVSSAGAQSARTSVSVAPQVTIDAPSAGTELFLGAARSAGAQASAEDTDAVTFTGTVTPAAPGTTVALQREDGTGSWSRIGGGVVGEEGRFSITHTFLRPGQARIRVLVHSHGLDMGSVSTPITYQISHRRNRKVTIDAAVDPITEGASVMITGTVAGAPDAPVTLLAQTGDGAFVAIAKAVTDGSEYSFTESPLASTRYRVLGDGVSSPILAEGVTWALTPSSPPATVAAGTQVSLTGIVAPLHEGQVVDLERLNSSGSGYHVIASGAIGAGSTYSIAYAFPAAGAALLRLSVPGNAELEAAVSEAFKLEVTPAV
jgi:large repetitive protein